MVVYLARDGYYVSYAIGTDLTQWDNDQVALIVTETHALDWFISANLRHTKPLTRNINPMTASHYPKRLEIGKILGRVSTNHYLQTGILTFMVLGACTTVGNGAEITTVLCTTKVLSVENSTFHFWVTDGSEALTEYYCWINKGTGADPTETGTAIECDISGATTAIDVAEVIDGLIDAKANVGAENGGTATITITNAQNGGVPDCSSSEGTDTGYTITITTQGSSTHPITKITDEVPFSTAFHYEKEGTIANRRKDTLGIVPNLITISVSEIDTTAKQTYTGEFSFTGAGGNLAQPPAFSNNNLPPYEWFNYKNGSGASEFTYNGGAIDVDIVDVNIRAGWTGSLFGIYDETKYPRNGLVRPPFVGEVDLGVRIVDAGNTALDTISDLEHGSYAGDLDFIADFYISAIHYLKYTYDKMYIDPESYEEVFQEENEWFDGVRFTLKFLDETSSLVVGEKNPLDKRWYEND